jgi:hypothetical protein
VIATTVGRLGIPIRFPIPSVSHVLAVTNTDLIVMEATRLNPPRPKHTMNRWELRVVDHVAVVEGTIQDAVTVHIKEESEQYFFASSRWRQQTRTLLGILDITR